MRRSVLGVKFTPTNALFLLLVSQVRVSDQDLNAMFPLGLAIPVFEMLKVDIADFGQGGILVAQSVFIVHDGLGIRQAGAGGHRGHGQPTFNFGHSMPQSVESCIEAIVQPMKIVMGLMKLQVLLSCVICRGLGSCEYALGNALGRGRTCGFSLGGISPCAGALPPGTSWSCDSAAGFWLSGSWSAGPDTLDLWVAILLSYVPVGAAVNQLWKGVGIEKPADHELKTCQARIGQWE